MPCQAINFSSIFHYHYISWQFSRKINTFYDQILLLVKLSTQQICMFQRYMHHYTILFFLSLRAGIVPPFLKFGWSLVTVLIVNQYYRSEAIWPLSLGHNRVTALLYSLSWMCALKTQPLCCEEGQTKPCVKTAWRRPHVEKLRPPASGRHQWPDMSVKKPTVDFISLWAALTLHPVEWKWAVLTELWPGGRFMSKMDISLVFS